MTYYITNNLWRALLLVLCSQMLGANPTSSQGLLSRSDTEKIDGSYTLPRILSRVNEQNNELNRKLRAIEEKSMPNEMQNRKTERNASNIKLQAIVYYVKRMAINDCVVAIIKRRPIPIEDHWNRIKSLDVTDDDIVEIVQEPYRRSESSLESIKHFITDNLSNIEHAAVAYVALLQIIERRLENEPEMMQITTKIKELMKMPEYLNIPQKYKNKCEQILQEVAQCLDNAFACSYDDIG